MKPSVLLVLMLTDSYQSIGSLNVFLV